MFDSLVDLASSSAWTYALVFAMASLDVLAPIVRKQDDRGGDPGERSVRRCRRYGRLP